jgi:hypothetical protein
LRREEVGSGDETITDEMGIHGVKRKIGINCVSYELTLFG